MTEPVTGQPAGPVAVVGAGSIGVAWAVVFAAAGRAVRLVDLDPGRLVLAREETREKLQSLADADLLAEPAGQALLRVTTTTDLAEAVADAVHVQECVVEDLAVKQRLFADLDRLTGPEVVLASSTSTILPSAFAGDVAGRDRCLVVHPGNPPYFLRVAEVVPAPFTSAAAVARAADLLRSVDIAPVVLAAEIEGFVFNRLQGALLREAYALVRDGIVSPVDLDTLVREGLGQRWAILGPFATNELNTRGGLRRHAELHGRVYARLGIERADDDPWTPETVERVASAVEAGLPHREWADNVRERDRVMIEVAAQRRHLDNPLAPALGPDTPAVAATPEPAGA